MIIGVTGSYASGKDSVAEYLIKKGFQHFSLSDEIRKELKKRKIKETRQNLIKLGNELRKKHGNEILAKRIIELISKNNKNLNKNYLVSSIRNIGEVNELKKTCSFILVWVDALPKIRYNRLINRQRTGDLQTFEEFIKSENLEKSEDPNKQQLHKVKEMADIIIDNSGTLEELYDELDKKLGVK